MQPPSPLPPNQSAFNLADYVLGAGRLTPNKTALALVGPRGEEKWTYSQLETAIFGTAHKLLNLGLNPGDRLLLRIGNEVAFPITFLAAITVGIIPVPTSIGLTKSEINKVAGSLRPHFGVASPNAAIPDNIPVLPVGELMSTPANELAKPVFDDANRPAYIILTSGTSSTGSPGYCG